MQRVSGLKDEFLFTSFYLARLITEKTEKILEKIKKFENFSSLRFLVYVSKYIEANIFLTCIWKAKV